MNKVRSREYKIIELVILSGFIFSVLYTPVFQIIGMKIEVFVLGLLLSIGYMFFGYYLFGKPSPAHDLSYSALLGIVYSFGVMALMFNALGFAAAFIFSMISLVTLNGLLVSLVFLKLKRKMRESYLKAQFVRTIIFLLLNVFYLLYSYWY